MSALHTCVIEISEDKMFLIIHVLSGCSTLNLGLTETYVCSFARRLYNSEHFEFAILKAFVVY